MELGDVGAFVRWPDKRAKSFIDSMAVHGDKHQKIQADYALKKLEKRKQ